MKFETVNDLYYTVNKEGQRTKIDSSCIHFSSTGSRTENSWEFPFANLEVTRTACSQNFQPMAEVPENQEHPAEKKMRDLMQRIQERYMNKVK